MSDALRKYKLPPKKGEGWAVIVIDMNGFFSTVSDWGNFAFNWLNTGEDDFRKFLLDLEPDYLADKLGKVEKTFNGEASAKAVREAVNGLVESEATGFDVEWEKDRLSDLGDSPSEPDFWMWLNSTEVERAYDLAVWDQTNTADGFVKHILPRFKELLKAELEMERTKTPPAIDVGHRHNFDTLKKAEANGDLLLLSCLDKKTLKPVVVVAAREPGEDEKGNIQIVPLAKMFDGNPFEELIPPKAALDS